MTRIKNIWFLNDYAGSPRHGMTLRHYYLAKSLQGLGVRSTIISASYSHLLTSPPEVRDSYSFEDIDDVQYLWIKVPRYERAFSLGRVWKWAVFFFRIFLLPIRSMEKPDVIIVSPSAPFPIVPAWWIARRLGAKLVFEVRDIWPLTLTEVGNISPRHPFILLMAWFERFALKNSDFIVSNLYNYKTHVRNLNIDREVVHIPNGIYFDGTSTQFGATTKHEHFTVGYTGKLGKSNALEDLIDAARLLQENSAIKFLIVGAGEEKESLKARAKDLKNVRFMDSVPKSEIPAILARLDVCYIGLKDMPLFKFGTSPNKLFDYLLAAKPVLYAINDGENLVERANAGVSVAPGDPSSIASGITLLSNMASADLYAMGQNGKRYVHEHHDYRVLASRLIDSFTKQ